MFVLTDHRDVFVSANAALRDSERWGQVRVAYREATGDTFAVLWPPGLADFAVT